MGIKFDDKNIVVFDGICSLCNFSVDLLIKLDRNKMLFFTSMQGKAAKQLNIYQERLSEKEQSILYKKRNSNIIYYRSDAIIEIFHDIFSWGKIFTLFKVIPKSLRDIMYKFIAKNRYMFFGKRETCRIPSFEEKERFLD